MLHLECIPSEYWVPFICSRFEKYGKHISKEYATRICEIVKNYSSYVQQLAWNVMAETEKEVDEDCLQNGINTLLQQCSSLFIQQTEDLSAYQMNFLHALANGVNTGFTQSTVLKQYQLGTAANITRLKKALTEKDLITTIAPKTMAMSDPILQMWLKRRVWRE